MYALCSTPATRCYLTATAEPTPAALELADGVEDGVEGWGGHCESYHPEEHGRGDI